MKGYLVKYSVGAYDEYREICVAVYKDKQDAEMLCKGLDDVHFNPIKSEISDENWESIIYEYDKILMMKESEFEHSDEYPYLYLGWAYDDPDFKEKHKQRIESENKLLEDLVIQKYPDWNRKYAREQIRLYEVRNTDEFSKCWIEEIEII